PLAPVVIPQAPAAAAPRFLAANRCYCDSCSDIVGPCTLCPRCQCEPDGCGCPGQPPCTPPPPPTTPCHRVGTPGQTGGSCPHGTRFEVWVVTAEACREAVWDSVIDELIWLVGGPDANDICG